MKLRFALIFFAAVALAALFLSPARAEVPPGTLQPNDLFMPYLGGVVVFKNTFDLTDPVRGWFIERGTHGLADMRGITIGPDGNFYLAANHGDWPDSISDCILRFNGTTGAFIDEFVPPGSGGLSNPESLAFLSDGNLYVASATGDILRYNAVTGAPDPLNPVALPSATFQDFGIPTCLFAGSDGCLYIGAGAAVMRYNPLTNALNLFATSTDMVRPRQMAFGPDGNLYIADEWNGSTPIKVFNGTTGETMSPLTLLGDLTGANGLAFGPDGRLYVDGGTITDGNGTGVIDRYDLVNGTTTRLITPDNFPPTGAGGGQFLFNKGITLTGSNVAVTPIPTTSLTFGSVSTAGQTTVTPLSSDTTNLPENFDVATSTGGIATYFDITTTIPIADVAKGVTLSIGYDATQFRSDINPTGPDPKLMHFVNGSWVDITTGFDPAAHKVTGYTTSFSPFAVVKHAAYSWSGVLQPINADGSSVFKQGSTVPVKFNLTGASAGITNLQAKLYLSQVNTVDPTAANEADSTSAADTGNTFRYSGGQYVFNLSTKNLSQGTWYLRIDLGDGASHIVQIKLKK